MSNIRRLNKARNPLCLAPLALLTIKPSIQDRNTAIGISAIRRSDLTETPLETMVQPRDLMPGTQITVLIERCDGLNTIGHPGTGSQKQAHQTDHYMATAL